VTEPTMTLDSTAGDGALIEELTRKASYQEPPTAYSVDEDGAHIVRVLRQDERVETFNLERWQEMPARNRGKAVLFDPDNFVTYVTRLGDTATTVWGNESALSFTAVFNDHETPRDPGWRDHTAVLQLQNDPEWDAFNQRSGRYMNQLDFAEFLQDFAPSIVQPDGATILEVAMNFKAHRKADFESAVDLDTGDVAFRYSEVTNAKAAPKSGDIEVPREFVVALSPFLGMDTVPVTARLRFDVQKEGLQIGFRLVRPDLVRRDAFTAIRNKLGEGLQEDGIAVLLGAAPGPVTPEK
jgi:uncharacterized protein YfdQ (DUF2303 family)